MTGGHGPAAASISEVGEGRMSSYGKSAVFLVLLALPLAGCGIKGSLDAPPQAQAQGTATSPDAKGSAEGSEGPKKVHRPSILDGLLR